MKTILLVLATVFITTQYKAQNNEAPSAEQMAEWRRIAHEEGQKTVVGSTIKNFFRNKLIFLVIGGAVVLIGGAFAVSNKDQNQ
jgi:hypothetical protein